MSMKHEKQTTDESITAEHVQAPEADAAPSEAPKTAARRFGPDAAVALALVVMMNAPGYRTLFLSELEWVLFPPILANQYKLYMQGVKPVAFAAWAMVTPEVDARLRAGDARLKPTEWTGGDIIWIIHLIAPFGGADASTRMVEDLGRTVLAGKAYRLHRTHPDGVKAEQGE